MGLFGKSKPVDPKVQCQVRGWRGGIKKKVSKTSKLMDDVQGMEQEDQEGGLLHGSPDQRHQAGGAEGGQVHQGGGQEGRQGRMQVGGGGELPDGTFLKLAERDKFSSKHVTEHMSLEHHVNVTFFFLLVNLLPSQV